MTTAQAIDIYLIVKEHYDSETAIKIVQEIEQSMADDSPPEEKERDFTNEKVNKLVRDVYKVLYGSDDVN